MRITPIESPRGVLLRLLNWAFRRQFGRGLTPYDVVFARLPRTVWAQLGIYRGLAGLDVDHGLQLLLQVRVASMNGCSFCVDIGRAVATYQGLTLEKADAVDQWRTSPLFTERERAALAYVEEATRDRRVSDETFATLRAHFTDREIVAITWLNAVENYFNMINGPLQIESDGLCAIAEQRTKGGRRSAPAAEPLRRSA